MAVRECKVMLSEVLPSCPDERVAAAFASEEPRAMSEVMTSILSRDVCVEALEGAWVIHCPADELDPLGKIFKISVLSSDANSATASDVARSSEDEV